MQDLLEKLDHANAQLRIVCERPAAGGRWFYFQRLRKGGGVDRRYGRRINGRHVAHAGISLTRLGWAEVVKANGHDTRTLKGWSNEMIGLLKTAIRRQSCKTS